MTDAAETPAAETPAAVRTPRVGQRAWLVLVVVLAVVAALLCWRHLRDGRPHATTGATLFATGPFGVTTASTVVLPNARLDVRATSPLDDVADDPAVRSMQAPDGGSFVGLRITPTDDPAIDRWTLRSSTTRTRPDIGYALVADGRRYPLTTYDRFGQQLDDDDTSAYDTRPIAQQVYVAVAGKPRRLQLVVTFAGEMQTVDLRTGTHDAGRFASLYANATRSRSCGAVRWQAGYASDVAAPACRVDSSQRTPYYSGYGWAPAGTTWVVADIATTLPTGIRRVLTDGRFARYDAVGLPTMSFRLDGVPARGSGLFSNVFGPGRRDIALFTAPTGSRIGALDVAVTYRDTSVRRDSIRDNLTYDPTVTASWRVTLP